MLSRYGDRSVPCTNRTQRIESRNESNPVLPNSTATTATRPGAATTVARPARGERTTTRPSREPQIDSFPASVE